MKVNIFNIGYTRADWDSKSRNYDNLHIADAGYAEVKEFDPEELWDLLNWSCWTDTKPEEVANSPLTHCNSDIALNIDGTNEYYIALSCGWKKITADSLEEVLNFFKTDDEASFNYWPLYNGVKQIL